MTSTPITCFRIGLFFLLCASPLSAQISSWTQQLATNTPSPRRNFGFAHDSALGQQVLFGGRNNFATFFDETYVYDGVSAWTLFPQTTKPSPRTCAMAYDASRGVHVVYGGGDGTMMPPIDTWEFNGLSWSQAGTIVVPGIKIGTAMSYDSAQAKIVLFSGYDLTPLSLPDTWTYDATGWTFVSSGTGPFARRNHQLVYDSWRGVHVLFAGSSPSGFKYDDTWEFDLSTGVWTQVTTAMKPPARDEHAMAYDATRGVTILYGGRDANNQPLNDTWEFDGVDWVLVPTTVSPSARYAAQFASNDTAGTAILFGGEGSVSPPTDTWLYASSQPLYPGTGGDCAIEVSINGSFSAQGSGVHALNSGDSFGLNLLSPQGTLDSQFFALIYTLYPQGSPPAGLALLGGVGGTALDVWVDPASAVVFLDSLTPSVSVLIPLLNPGGFGLGPYNVPVGLSGLAANLQLFVSDIGVNPVNLSTSNAAVLEFQ